MYIAYIVSTLYAPELHREWIYERLLTREKQQLTLNQEEVALLFPGGITEPIVAII